MGAIQRLGKDHYRVSIEGRPKADGRRTRHTKVVRGPRSEAEAVLARMKLDEGKLDACEITLSGYWEQFYKPTISRLAAHTQSGYERTWKNLVAPLFGDRVMSELKARDIERGLLTIEKPGSQRNAFKLMRQMFNEAYRDEVIDENPFFRRIRTAKVPKYEPEILLVDDLPLWLEAVRGSKYEPVLLVMLFGGLRREEACALFWEDFDFGVDTCAVRVDKTLVEVSGKLVEGPTKTVESTRTVFLAGWPASRLLELLSEGPLVPDANGKRMRPDKISREYHDLIARKQVEKETAGEESPKYVPMKNLRNSYATIMQGLGASDSLISKSLGHTNLKVDYDHYFAANAPAHVENAKMLGEAVLHRVTS